MLVKWRLCLLFLFGPILLHSTGPSHVYNGTYSAEYAERIAFPLGGMGAGMICLEGSGSFNHFSLRHKPRLYHEPQVFAAITVLGKQNIARVIEGQVPPWKIVFPQMENIWGGGGHGRGGKTYGLPRFRESSFAARFPFAEVNLNDEKLPIAVTICGWSPFVPGDEDASSLPVAALEYTFKNTGNSPVDAVFSFHAENMMRSGGDGGDRVLPLQNGFQLHQGGGEDKGWNRGDMAIQVLNNKAEVDCAWFRGGWFDTLTMVWKHIMSGKCPENEPFPANEKSSQGGSLYVPISLQAGEKETVKLLISWYVPQSDISRGGPPETECCDSSDCCDIPKNYIPWYASRFGNIKELRLFWKSNYESLYKSTQAFTDCFYSMTLPDEVIEAVAANLTILKSPTVLRQHDGRLWGYEGCHDNLGCCHGSCTHVWNYAQAIPHLFPRLERSLRETEFGASQDNTGHQTFRSSLPIHEVGHDFHAAADGQLGGIIKVYREWRISGDSDWMKNIWPRVRQSLDYCIKTWDPRHTGLLEEPHHNTYDIEYWGPEGHCGSFYLSALSSAVRMGKHLGDDVTLYQMLLKKGQKRLEKELFNGEYFVQKIQWEGLNAESPVGMKGINMNYSREAIELLEKEGPKYQYGNGCLSDGVLGFWMAEMAGINNNIVSASQLDSHLKSVFQYNFKEDLSTHANPQRPGYAWGPEGGLLICTWPRGGDLTLPFVYSNEVWTGIEYQVASHLMCKGYVEEGLTIVRACRDRYDGRVRNPFDEYECGHWYARAMASYGLIQGLTGIFYDAVDQILYIDPRIGDSFVSFLATETGFGCAGLKNGSPFLEVKRGEIAF